MGLCCLPTTGGNDGAFLGPQAGWQGCTRRARLNQSTLPTGRVCLVSENLHQKKEKKKLFTGEGGMAGLLLCPQHLPKAVTGQRARRECGLRALSVSARAPCKMAAPRRLASLCSNAHLLLSKHQHVSLSQPLSWLCRGCWSRIRADPFSPACRTRNPRLTALCVPGADGGPSPTPPQAAQRRGSEQAACVGVFPAASERNRNRKDVLLSRRPRPFRPFQPMAGWKKTAGVGMDR